MSSVNLHSRFVKSVWLIFIHKLCVVAEWAVILCSTESAGNKRRTYQPVVVDINTVECRWESSRKVLMKQEYSTWMCLLTHHYHFRHRLKNINTTEYTHDVSKAAAFLHGWTRRVCTVWCMCFWEDGGKKVVLRTGDVLLAAALLKISMMQCTWLLNCTDKYAGQYYWHTLLYTYLSFSPGKG